MKIRNSLPFAILLLASLPAQAETLESYAQKCDAAIGVTVPDFVCDDGAPVPTTDDGVPVSTIPADGKCDRPNVLNSECDPGSVFTTLRDDGNAIVVAHCRKQNVPNTSQRNAAGKFGDIAVIQHNKSNGATCFYQALQNSSTSPGPLDGRVKAPSKGLSAYTWLPPADTARIGCGGCHDNGPIVRSPYLTQLATTPGAKFKLPGSGDVSFNSGQPYYFVGDDFASWKTYKVEVQGNLCIGCHTMGVNNIRPGNGTSLDLGIRATNLTQAAKNPHSPTSPIWMTIDRRTLPLNQQHSTGNASAALEIKNCAMRFRENPLPNSASCRITERPGPPPVGQPQPPSTIPPWLPAVL
jgi:hypothetical protein